MLRVFDIPNQIYDTGRPGSEDRDPTCLLLYVAISMLTKYFQNERVRNIAGLSFCWIIHDWIGIIHVLATYLY